MFRQPCFNHEIKMANKSGSKAFGFSLDDLKKVAIGAAIAAAGAILAYLTEWLSGQDLGEWGPLVGAVLAVLTNFLRKIASDTTRYLVISFVALALLIGDTAIAADITAPERVDPYTLVKVTSKTKGKGYAWFVIGPKGFVPLFRCDLGADCVFTGPPGAYNVLLVVSTDTGALDQGQASVIIGDAPPTPPTPPGPNPPGPTPIPDGSFGLSKLAVEWASPVPSAARGKAAAFSTNFESVASQIAAGGFASVTEANAALKAKNAATAGTDRDAWLTWFNAFAAKMTSLYTSGTVTTLPQHSEAYLAIAAGLKLVK